MTDSVFTRRNVLGAIATTPALAIIDSEAVAMPIGDATLIAAWEIRQSALAEIEAKGSFFDAETLAPAAVDVFDDADIRITRAEAATPRGVLIKAWVAWTYLRTQYTPREREIGDLIRRADFARLEAIWHEDDFGDEAMLAVIRSLRVLAGEA